MFFCNTSIVNLYISDMKYLIGIMLIGMLASCGNDSPEWVINNAENGAILKLNTKTGEAMILDNTTETRRNVTTLGVWYWEKILESKPESK